MKVTVNLDTCIAAGLCGEVAPKVFRTAPENDGYVELLDANPPESEWAAVREAALLCPSASIDTIDEGR